MVREDWGETRLSPRLLDVGHLVCPVEYGWYGGTCLEGMLVLESVVE